MFNNIKKKAGTAGGPCINECFVHWDVLMLPCFLINTDLPYYSNTCTLVSLKTLTSNCEMMHTSCIGGRFYYNKHSFVLNFVFDLKFTSILLIIDY